jgi:hypothetical protein
MSRTSDLIELMRRNPAADWRISDIERVCVHYRLSCLAPKGGGSHWKVGHPSQREILTIPAHRPIKAVYVRKLVKFIDAVLELPHARP